LILAAGTFDDTGSDLFQKLRKAVTTLQGVGFSPDVALLSPSDVETLDLTRGGTGDGGFLVDPAPRSSAFSPLWNLKVVAAAGVDVPIVLDSSAVTLYLGPVEFASNPYEGFSTNETRARLEGPAVLVAHQPNGIQVVGPQLS
jgi:hypothetical protein